MAATFISPYPRIVVPSTSFFEYAMQQNPLYPADLAAYVDGLTGETISRRVFEGKCLALASGLRSAHEAGLLPLSRGSTVQVISPSTTLYVTLIYALGAAGIRGLLDDQYNVPRELAYTFRLSHASHVIVHPTLLEKAVAALELAGISRNEAKRRIILLCRNHEVYPDTAGEGWVTLDMLPTENRITTIPENFGDARAHETAFLFNSCGQSGPFKLAEITHYNINGVLTQLSLAWKYYESARDRVLSTLPFDGVIGVLAIVLWSFFKGVPVVILPKFEPKTFLGCIPKYKITATFLASPLLMFLAKHPAIEKADLSTLRLMPFGGAAPDYDVLSAAMKRLANRGYKLTWIETYGMMEACLAVSWVEVTKERGMTGVGQLSPGTEGRVVNEKGEDVGPHVVGELWLRGPIYFKGYYNDPEATRETYADHGWFKTGDLVSRDEDGNIFVRGRKKHFVKYNACQVSLFELEELVKTHPAVADVGVVGVYGSTRINELPRAYVVPRNPEEARSIGEEAFGKAINSWLKGQVGDYKLLRGGVLFAESIPRDAAGRVDRPRLQLLVKTSAKL